MKQVMKALHSRDGDSSPIDQPVDLRVCSARERDTFRDSATNYILASLLTRSPEIRSDRPSLHLDEQQQKECVPNYRKFYSRCFSQRSSNRRSQESAEATSRPKDTYFDPPSRVQSPQPSTALAYRKFYSRCYLENANRQKDPYDECLVSDSSSRVHSGYFNQRSPTIRSRESAHLETTHRQKDHFIRCLLSDPSTRVHLETTSGQKQHFDKRMLSDASNHVHLVTTTNRQKDRFDVSDTSNRVHLVTTTNRQKDHFDVSDISSRIHRPQPVRAVPGILKSILLSPVLLSPSGSPGSESTSSGGSTDSGVFSSDNVLEDRPKRVARVLSGTHVKSGTGASLHTLRRLRQMILQRKANRKL